jgi:hypothetical protein
MGDELDHDVYSTMSSRTTPSSSTRGIDIHFTNHGEAAPSTLAAAAPTTTTA